MTKLFAVLVLGSALLFGSGCSDQCRKWAESPTTAPEAKEKPKADKKCDCTDCNCKKCPGKCDDKDCECKGCASNCCKKKDK